MINKSVPFFQRVSTTHTSRQFLCQRKPTAAKTSLFLPEDQWRTCFTECVNRTTFLTWWRTPRVSAIIMHTAIVQPVLLTTAQHPLVYLANFFFIYFIKVYLDFLLFLEDFWYMYDFMAYVWKEFILTVFPSFLSYTCISYLTSFKHEYSVTGESKTLKKHSQILNRCNNIG